MRKIQYNGSSKIVNNIIAKVNLIIDKLVVDVKVNGTSVVVVNQEGEREADIDLSLADQNVKQSPTTSSDNSDYRVLLSKSANDTEETDISRKDTNLKYNPSTGNLQTTKLNGNTVPSGSDTIALTSDIPTVVNTYDGTSTDAISGMGVKAALDTLPEPMVYKGSLGVGGTIADLPMDGSATIGDTYKVITEGDYGNNTYHAKVGDTFICFTKTSSANTWTLIPSGDEPSGTVTSITIKATSPIAVNSSSAITTSGTRTISHVESGVTASSYGDSSAQTPGFGGTFKALSATVNATGHVTAMGEHTVTIPSAVATTSASGLMSASDKTKLDGIAQGAEANVQSDWSITDTSSDAFIKNKPSIPTITDTYSGTSHDGMSGVAVKSAIDALDGNLNNTTPGAGKTLTAFSQTDGKVSAKFENISISKSQAGLGNVDNTSDATKKTNFTGSIASGNTGFVTGGDIYTALQGKADTSDIPTDFVKASTGGTFSGNITVAKSHTGTTDNQTILTVGNNKTSTGMSSGALKLFSERGTGKFIRLFNDNTLTGSSADRRYKLPVDKPNDSELAVVADIPTALSDLTDDSTHRLVTDTEKSTWNGKAELTDVDKAELNTWNLLRQPYYHKSGTSSGTTRTVNADGSVTFTGTATENFNFNFKRYTQEWKLPKGKYRIIGCPVGGSDTTYFLRVQKYTTSLATLATDYGYGAEFTLTEETTMHIVASIISGYAIQDSLTFTPYLIPVDKMAWNDYAEYGVKNLIPYPWYSVNGRENRGITFTFNEEGYIALSGTASTTQQPFFQYTLRTAAGIKNGKTVKVKSGKRYTLSIDRTDDRLWGIVYIGDSTGTAASVSTRAVFEDGATRNTTSEYVSMNYSSKLHTSVTFEIVTEGEYYLQVDLRVNSNSGQYDPTLAKGRVMLRDANISDDTWANYASSNFTLTRKKADYSQITTVETSDVASKAYTVGEYMIWRGGFYVVRADIASGDSIASGTNVEATDLGSEVKKSKIWGNENIATIPNSSSSSKVYVTTSAYSTEIYVQRMNIRSTSLGINETGYCSVTIPILPSMTNNYFVFMFRGDVDNKLYDGRLLFKKDSNGVYGYVSKVYQDGVLKSANDLEADIVVFEKS